jgi:glycosyltransferase involved in cell wall biosynthesis
VKDRKHNQAIICVSNDLVYDRRMTRVAEHLTDLGLHVACIGRKRKSGSPLPVRSYGQKRLHCFFEKGPLFYAVLNLRLLLLLIQTRPRLIVSMDTDTLLAGSLASLLVGSRIIFDAHELFPEVPELAGRPRVQRFWRSIEKFCIPRVKHKMTVSESIANYYRNKGWDNWTVVRNVPLRFPLKSPIESSNAIYYQGALNRGRGLEQVIRALPDMDAELWLAGDGDLSMELRSLVSQLNLDQRVRFLGMLNTDELQHFAQRAAVGLNLLDLESSLSYQFSLANKFFDYIHAGLPVITMKAPEYARIMEKHKVGVLVEDMEPQTIRDALATIRENSGFFRQQCIEAQEVLHWDLEKYKLTELIEKVLN